MGLVLIDVVDVAHYCERFRRFGRRREAAEFAAACR
jgi:hypothetical protein